MNINFERCIVQRFLILITEPRESDKEKRLEQRVRDCWGRKKVKASE